MGHVSSIIGPIDPLFHFGAGWCRVLRTQCVTYTRRSVPNALRIRTQCVRSVPNASRTQGVPYPIHYVPNTLRTQCVTYPIRYVLNALRTAPLCTQCATYTYSITYTIRYVHPRALLTLMPRADWLTVSKIRLYKLAVESYSHQC